MLRQSRVVTVLRFSKKGMEGEVFFHLWMLERCQPQIHELRPGYDPMNKSAHDSQSARAPTAQGN